RIKLADGDESGHRQFAEALDEVDVSTGAQVAEEPDSRGAVRAASKDAVYPRSHDFRPFGVEERRAHRERQSVPAPKLLVAALEGSSNRLDEDSSPPLVGPGERTVQLQALHPFRVVERTHHRDRPAERVSDQVDLFDT